MVPSLIQSQFSGLFMFISPWLCLPQALFCFYPNLCLPNCNSESKSESCLACLTLCNPVNSTVHGILQTRIMEWISGLFLLQGIFPTQGSNPGLPYCRRILYQLSHKGSPRILEWVVFPFSNGSSWPRNQTGVSCIADRFFTNWAR